MDSKITLSFDKSVIDDAKAFAKKNNVSLSRLTEFLYRKITSGEYKFIDEFPIENWVNQVAEGEASYVKRGRKSLKEEFMNSRK
jgi:hypothetical protein